MSTTPKKEEEAQEQELQQHEKDSIELGKHKGRSIVWKYFSDVQVKESVQKDPSKMTDVLTKALDPNYCVCTLCLADNKSLKQSLVKFYKGNPANGQAHLETKHPDVYATLDLNYKGNKGENVDAATETEGVVTAAAAAGDGGASSSPPPKKKRKRKLRGGLDEDTKPSLAQIKQESDELRGIAENVNAIFENVSKLQASKIKVGPGDRSEEVDSMCETMMRFSKRLLESAEAACSSSITKETTAGTVVDLSKASS